VEKERYYGTGVVGVNQKTIKRARGAENGYRKGVSEKKGMVVGPEPYWRRSS